MRCVVTDDLWDAWRPLVARAQRTRQGSKPKVPGRAFFEAVLYLARTGIPWRELPSALGRWEAVYNRFRRWVPCGGRKARFELVTAHPQRGEYRRGRIDSTIVRAHPHGAGARRKNKRSGPRGPEPGPGAQARGA